VITASDKKYALADISDSVITAYNAELPSTYDYYPFGMLMPGRYTSDTSTQCATITQTVMVPTVVTYTDPLTIATVYNLSVSALSGITANTINIATTAANQGITLPLANAEVFKENTFELTVNRIPTGLEYIAEIYEYNIGDTLLLTSMAVDRDATFTLHFKPCGSGNVGLVLKTINALSSSSTTKFKNFFTTVTTYTAQSITTTICNTGGDRYRFGFNGMEKDNEMKGVGNSLDFGARMYDSRLGRWLSMDPLTVRYPHVSPYAFVGNSPISLVDPDGKKWVNYYDKMVALQTAALLFVGPKLRKKILEDLRTYTMYQEIVNDIIQEMKFYDGQLYNYIADLKITYDLINCVYEDVVVVVRYNPQETSQTETPGEKGDCGQTRFGKVKFDDREDAYYNGVYIVSPKNEEARTQDEAIGFTVEIWSSNSDGGPDVSLANECGDVWFFMEENAKQKGGKSDDTKSKSYTKKGGAGATSQDFQDRYSAKKKAKIKSGSSYIKGNNASGNKSKHNNNANNKNTQSKGKGVGNKAKDSTIKDSVTK
jgi:RHS repeat-associated protein